VVKYYKQLLCRPPVVLTNLLSPLQLTQLV